MWILLFFKCELLYWQLDGWWCLCVSWISWLTYWYDFFWTFSKILKSYPIILISVNQFLFNIKSRFKKCIKSDDVQIDNNHRSTSIEFIQNAENSRPRNQEISTANSWITIGKFILNETLNFETSFFYNNICRKYLA